VIEVSGLAKSFGELRVLSDISFRVDRDEFVTIFGPSGCGKTTILRILAALETPDAGRVLVDGVDGLARRDDYKRKISIVWQDPRLLPWRTALGNVAFSLEMRHPDLPRPEVMGRAGRALGLVGLTAFASTLPRQLSGGMRQRVNLARALALDAEIMLMDEPLASLNEITDKRQLMGAISAIWEMKRKTVVYVTHSVSEAVSLSDRIVVFSDKPTRILGEIRVPVARPRDLTSKEVVEICNHITELLGGLIA
jgi:ABC-type nitrate/sulfonate/bicarbonate transport system ATPase subunit